jgi:hypothetical protein
MVRPPLRQKKATGRQPACRSCSVSVDEAGGHSPLRCLFHRKFASYCTNKRGGRTRPFIFHWSTATCLKFALRIPGSLPHASLSCPFRKFYPRLSQRTNRLFAFILRTIYPQSTNWATYPSRSCFIMLDMRTLSMEQLTGAYRWQRNDETHSWSWSPPKRRP